MAADPKTTKKPELPTDFLLDKRLTERNVAKGNLAKADLEKHLKDLPDLADKCDNIASIVYPQQH